MDGPTSPGPFDDDRWRRLAALSTSLSTSLAASTAATTASPPRPTVGSPTRDVPAPTVDPPLPRSCVGAQATHVAPSLLRDAVDVATRQRLDAFQESMTGTYRTPDGKALKVSTPFQMGAGYSNQRAYLDPKTSDHLQQRDLAAQHAHLPPGAYGRVICGRGSPAEIHALTQALVDMQPPGSIATSAQLRRLMFDNSIGIDCAGYVQQALLSATGKTRAQAGLANALNESLSNLGHRGFTRVKDVGDLRPGDVVVLGAPPGESVGHRTIVYEQRLANAGELRSLLVSGDPAQAAFAVGGPIRTLEVDSSWGCGGNAQRGGVQRETWLYNESSHQWASWNPSTASMWTSAGPYGHPLEGFFRSAS